MTLMDFYRQQGVIRLERELLSANVLFRTLRKHAWRTGCMVQAKN